MKLESKSLDIGNMVDSKYIGSDISYKKSRTE